MMRNQLILVLLGLTITGAVAAAAWAQHPRSGSAGPDLKRLKEEVGLNDDQVAQLKKLWSDSRKAAIRRKADIRIARIDLHELLDAPNLDERLVAAKVKELTDLQAGALKARVEARLSVRKILSPEQREKMKEFRHRRFERRRPARRGALGMEHEDGPVPDEPAEALEGSL